MSVPLAFASLLAVAMALQDGLAHTPPMGFNSYMSPRHDHAHAEGFEAIASFFISSGMRENGYLYINTDEGWETKSRDSHGRLQWDGGKFPMGLPAFIDGLHNRSLKFGIYGAASGVTCGNDPGMLFHEEVDAATYASWGVDFVKSDNCASYALDPSVRYGAARDALNRTGRPMVLSIEPFSIHPDPEQSVELAHMWRVGCDIRADLGTFLDRADLSDKWSPLAGPGGWNDPDMIAVRNPPSDAQPPPAAGLRPLPTDQELRAGDSTVGFTLGENRLYFGLWAMMKSPLLLSADLPNLSTDVVTIINNSVRSLDLEAYAKPLRLRLCKTSVRVLVRIGGDRHQPGRARVAGAQAAALHGGGRPAAPAAVARWPRGLRTSKWPMVHAQPRPGASRCRYPRVEGRAQRIHAHTTPAHQPRGGKVPERAQPREVAHREQRGGHGVV